ALQPAAISAVIIVNPNEYTDEEGRAVKKRAAVFVEEAQRPLAIGKKGQNIHLATKLSGFELDMYNYEELPKFQAKLAEIQGQMPQVTVFVSEEEGGEASAEAAGENPVEAVPEAVSDGATSDASSSQSS
ncbi:MAG TPA: hypothetical protein VJB60_04380, partial [Candidatus Peribacterales bacterium]|nr:hypothetical protein [Candidatus Peribacterales bacterium]